MSADTARENIIYRMKQREVGGGEEWTKDEW